jgi:hypothetical protein
MLTSEETPLSVPTKAGRLSTLASIRRAEDALGCHRSSSPSIVLERG